MYARPLVIRACSVGSRAWPHTPCRPHLLGPSHFTPPTASSSTAAIMEEELTLLTAHAHSPAERQALEERLSNEEFPQEVCFAWPDGLPAPHKQRPTAPLQPAPLASFNGQLYMDHLTSALLGKLLLTAQEVGSTQDFMRAHHSRLPSGTVLTAERQVSGRGRGGNQWTSPAGCLMFTASRPLAIPGAQAPFINYVVCLGVLRGIQDAVAITHPGLPPIDIRIKWPNDMYCMPQRSQQNVRQHATAGVQGSLTEGVAAAGDAGVGAGVGVGGWVGAGVGGGALKIGGALMHTTYSGGRFNLLVGIGLNLHNRQPTTCLQALLEEAVEVHAASGPAVGQLDPREVQGAGAGAVPRLQPEVLLARVISHLDDCLQVFETQGFAPLESSYLAAWMHTGQRVMFEKHTDQSLTAVTAAMASASVGGGEAPPGAGAGSQAGGASQAGDSQGPGGSHAAEGLGGADAGAAAGAGSVAGAGVDVGPGAGSGAGVQGGVQGLELVALEIQGLSSTGFLLAVEEGTGRQYELTPDGNSLDMLAGLIRRKLPQ